VWISFFRRASLTGSLAGCLVLSSLLTLGCEQPRQAAGDAKPASDSAVPRYSGAYPFEVVTTCGMVTDIVRQVVGEQGNVVGLMGEGVDPHLYKPTRNDVRRLLGADLVFYSGLMLEGRMGDAFTQVARKGRPVFAVTENIDESYLLEPPHLEGHWDPHVWMDVAAWSQCVEFVADVLQEFDPDHAANYKRRADAYRAELAELDAYVRGVIATIPERQRVLVTAHDAFGYFSRAYGIAVHSVQGISTESEPAVSDINRLVDLLVERKLPAIFVESSVNPENIRAVIEGAQQRGWQVQIGAELYSDAMGPPGTYEGTYLGMIDHNATHITRALGGDAPERGWKGKLRVMSTE
jgi:manganese/zinc/iron transport system substrate-binding protein